MYDMNKPSLKDILIVVLVFLVIIALSWLAYYRFGLFH